MKTVIASVAFAAAVLSAGAASAGSSGGFAALSLAELVGLPSPQLSNAQKNILLHFQAGNTMFPSSNAPIHVTASSIDCGASNVDITHYRCTLSFGSPTVQLTGKAAEQLYATLVMNGVPSDGAAGTIHEGVSNLSCTVNVAEVKDRAGGGANCTFSPF
jgi:hypothetical protein